MEDIWGTVVEVFARRRAARILLIFITAGVSAFSAFMLNRLAAECPGGNSVCHPDRADLTVVIIAVLILIVAGLLQDSAGQGAINNAREISLIDAYAGAVLQATTKLIVARIEAGDMTGIVPAAAMIEQLQKKTNRKKGKAS